VEVLPRGDRQARTDGGIPAPDRAAGNVTATSGTTASGSHADPEARLRAVISDRLSSIPATRPNCPDIPWTDFKVTYNVAEPDPHDLDGNKNGIACET
jgi:hypothetical protein